MSGVSAGQLRQLSATLIATAPTVNDDASKNYIVGSCVFCAFDSTFYECTDNTIGAAVWSPVSGGGGTPGGADTEVQFNDGGAFGGDANFTFDKTDAKVSINGNDSMTVNGAAITTHLQVHASDGITETEVELHRHGATAAAGAQLYGARSRGTEAAPTVVSNGDRLLSITAVGYDGTDYATGAQIDFDVSAAPGNNDMPTDIIFKTSPDGSQTLTERARITQAGNLNIAGLTASQIVTTDASKNLQSTALLSLALGGTNKNMTASAGAVAYSDADSLELTSVGTAGQVLQSNGAAAPTWVEQWREVILSGNVTTTLDTATDVTGLSFSLAANSTYKARFTTRIGCSGTGGIKFGYSCPVDAVVGSSYIGSGANTGAQTAAGGSTTGTALGSLAFNTVAATIGMYWAEYLIVTGATAGTFQVQFASTTAGQTSTVFATNACLEYKKIA